VRSGRRITVALVALVVLAVLGYLITDLTGHSTTGSGASTGASGSSAVPGASASGLKVQPLSGLPSQAGQTYRLIQAGGPFPYPHNDGVVFANREHLLPAERSGYYHEYTVPTPSSSDRGARRLITGSAHELYYTGDHYDSFVVVDPKR
jgi:ribonuclease T1